MRRRSGRIFGVQLEDVANLRVIELGVNAFDNPTRAEFVDEVVGDKSFGGRTVARPVDVKRQNVAGMCRAPDLGECGELFSQPADLRGQSLRR